MLKIALLSPYHGGSHQAWAEGFARHSQADVRLFSLPARFWKWRMHGGAVTLAQQFRQADFKPDLLLATDMLDVTTFLALTREQTAVTPLVVYMHENQLTYPLPANKRSGPMRRQHGERDLHYVFVNYASMLAADLVLFNTRYHYESWFAALPAFLNHFPDYRNRSSVAELQAKSGVLPVGIPLAELRQGGRPTAVAEPPLILWNQRWEYDKNPKAFFAALFDLAAADIPFRLALCGEQFGKRPSIFDQAITRLRSHLVHVGHAPRHQYRDLLWAADITISTAYHEFFGISILEAIACHTFPLLPDRLSYPELIPPAYHADCLYEDEADLKQRLRRALTQSANRQRVAAELATAVAPYAWSKLAPRYDQRLSNVTAQFRSAGDSN